MTPTKQTKLYSKVGIAIMIFAAGYLLWFFKSTPAPVGIHAPAKIAPQVAPLPKVSTPAPKGVKTYVQAAKKTLKLPAAVIADDSIHVVESTRVEPDDHAHTLTTLYNTSNGETTTLDRREPLPWIAFKKTGAIGLSYNVITSTRTLYGRQDVLQIKQFYLSGMAALRSDRDKMVGLSVEYRW
ncbi:MAG: hypothetical protein WAW75_07915 [Gallionella sp.]